MNLWHLTPDAPREPPRVSSGEPVRLRIGTRPIEPGQSVRVSYRVVARDGARVNGEVSAAWQLNEGANSYWEAWLGPFSDADRVTYDVRGRAGGTEVSGPTASFSVGPKLYLALLWHQHQPIYKDTLVPEPRGSYLHPWVRLHALRDYYSMARLVGEYEGIHLTVNLSGLAANGLPTREATRHASEAKNRTGVQEQVGDRCWTHVTVTRVLASSPADPAFS